MLVFAALFRPGLLSILGKSIADSDTDTHSKKYRHHRYFLMIVSPILITEQ
jgi:hypothetical protein